MNGSDDFSVVREKWLKQNRCSQGCKTASNKGVAFLMASSAPLGRSISWARDTCHDFSGVQLHRNAHGDFLKKCVAHFIVSH